MPQKLLDVKHICASLQRMSSETVTKRMYRTGCSDSCLLLINIEHMFYPSSRKVSLVPSAGKQVMVRTGRFKDLPVSS